MKEERKKKKKISNMWRNTCMYILKMNSRTKIVDSGIFISNSTFKILYLKEKDNQNFLWVTIFVSTNILFKFGWRKSNCFFFSVLSISLIRILFVRDWDTHIYLNSEFIEFWTVPYIFDLFNHHFHQHHVLYSIKSS